MIKKLAVFLIAGFWLAIASGANAAECENEDFSSTFDAIQKVVFENRGCADSVCHGSAKLGNLDLRADVSYDNLVDVDAFTVQRTKRVVAGVKDASLLWINLAAKTLPSEYDAPLRAMPLDPLPAISENELEALRLWIESGAPRNGVVTGTAELLDTCLPPPSPIESKPLDPPAAGVGVQLRVPRTILQPRSEHEVCFVSYYDVTDQVPPQFLTPDGKGFRYKRLQARQDPLSHHLIANQYTGAAPPNDPSWGVFHCQGGPRDRAVCEPTDLAFCGAGYFCATDAVESVACIGFGPGDAGIGLNSAGLLVLQETAADFVYPDGVYNELPLKGTILWNSHAFNLSDQPGKLEAWLNLEFAAPDEQLSPVQKIFDINNIFSMSAPAFGTDEVCAFYEFDPNTHLYEISSHMHKRGKRFRIFEGRWMCDGGPGLGRPCSPLGVDLASDEMCPEASCASTTQVYVADCDRDHTVTVDEIISAVNISLGMMTTDLCREADPDRDARVSVDELVMAINTAMHGEPKQLVRDADKSLFYLSFVYNDPVVMRFNPPILFPGPESSLEERTYTYCALYDNGYTNPDEVKRKTTSPEPPSNFTFFGGPCRTPVGCTEGKIGAPCQGSTQEARDASCDSRPDAGDGFCDACPLRGGVTTEDEMFVLFGEYYIRP